MTAYTTPVPLPGGAAFASPPILIVGSSAQALRRASVTVEASGVRVADRVLVPQAMERLDRQIAASALWVELDQDVAGVDTLLDRVEQQVQDRGSGAVVAAPLNLIDMVMARISDPAIELVIAGDEPTRAAALALALTDCRPVRLSDAASDRSADRLRQLSDEVSRIASTLARLSTGPTAAPSRPAEVPASESPDVSADTIRSVIRARRLRARFFSEELFADPAWDMLLDLLQAEIAQLRVPVSSLCIAASVPATTALRWLKTMTEEGLFLRRADPHDGRRVFVELAPRASQAMRRYFAEVGRPAVV